MPKKQEETAKEQDKFPKTIVKIVENYRNLEQSLVNQLLLETPNHQPTTGTYREAVWRSLFEQIIPRKFCIDQGVFIIDSCGKISAVGQGTCPPVPPLSPCPLPVPRCHVIDARI